MLNHLKELNNQHTKLTNQLEISMELNRLFGSTDKALTAGAYSISKGFWLSKHVYVTIKDCEDVKVFQFSRDEFNNSPLASMKIQDRPNHPYPLTSITKNSQARATLEEE